MCGKSLLFGGDLSARECRQMLTDGKAITSRITASMLTGTAASYRYIKYDSEKCGGQL
jgi:hypothetical protein